jgi:restriction endonuclease Mrr
MLVGFPESACQDVSTASGPLHQALQLAAFPVDPLPQAPPKINPALLHLTQPLSEAPHEEIYPNLVQMTQDICTSQIPQATKAEDEDNEEDAQAEKTADQIYNKLANKVLDEILKADSDNNERVIVEILDK